MLHKGMEVLMDDGWRGKVERIAGDTVMCVRQHRREKHRAVDRSRVAVENGKAVVDWSSAAAKHARLEQEWESRPYD